MLEAPRSCFFHHNTASLWLICVRPPNQCGDYISPIT
jgi:hypothetical protein